MADYDTAALMHPGLNEWDLAQSEPIAKVSVHGFLFATSPLSKCLFSGLRLDLLPVFGEEFFQEVVWE